MSQKFIAKNHKKSRRKLKLFVFLFFFLLSIYITYQYLEQCDFKLTDKVLVKFLLKQENIYIKEDVSFLGKVKEVVANPVFLLNQNYKGLVKLEKEVKKEEQEKKEISKEPLIYIYNSHQTEEYAPSNIAEYSVKPTVLVGSYILQERFEDAGLPTLVEERSIKDLLRANQWNYNYSYRASRIYLDDVKKKYPSIRYFIDFHRDSLRYDKTTVTIGEKSYAKLLFLIGLENPDYEKNLAFTNQLNAKINEKYPGLSKGIYKKGGEGVNGVYNQDSSEYTILLEVGGPDNKITEVLNSVNAFSEAFREVIGTSEG